VRRGLAWLAGALGVAALVRSRRKRQLDEAWTPAPAPAPAPVLPPEADPADDLRAALDETRPEEAAAEEPASLEERRRQVHERAQEAIDAMRDDPPAS
jgi:hypothetical protein